MILQLLEEMKRSGEVWVHSQMSVLLTCELLLWAARDEAALGRKNRGELPGFLLLLDKTTLESVCPWYRVKTSVWLFWAYQRIKRVVCMKSKLMWGKSNRAYFLRNKNICLAAKILKFYTFILSHRNKYIFFLNSLICASHLLSLSPTKTHGLKQWNGWVHFCLYFCHS